MQIIKETNGDLTFVAGDSLSSLTDILANTKDNDLNFLAEMLESEGYSTNGRYMQISPENVGALTDAPMFSDVVNIEDNGNVDVAGDVWWFPNYCVEHFGKTLVDEGKVTFTKASY